MLNANLIKPEIDGDEYADSAPTIGALMIVRYSAPDLHRRDTYEADTSFFAAHPERRTYVRPAFELEFDNNNSKPLPVLWVQVEQYRKGFHRILPVWRGQAFWTDAQADSDEKTGSLVFLMCLRGGLSLSEWYGYISDQRIRKADESKKRSKKMVN